MRITVSGAHRTGKTTLIDELIRLLPKFCKVDEPFYQLEDEGYLFAEIPTLEDFELQLERSLESVVESQGNCIFDRSPYDIMAYLIAYNDSEGVDFNHWLPRVRDAMRHFDLAIFVPIEDPDRISLSSSDHKRLRWRVDEELQDIVLEDRWGFGVPTIEVTGSPDQRIHQVLAYYEGSAKPKRH